jgi:hypothetical protein
MGLSECPLTAGEKYPHRPFGDTQGGGDLAIAVTAVAEQ